jgi:hypothetical protein
MSGKQEHPIQAMGFWMFGFLSVVLAVLKLTVAGYWSWWRVMLPFLAFLGHNAVYLLAGERSCKRSSCRRARTTSRSAGPSARTGEGLDALTVGEEVLRTSR